MDMDMNQLLLIHVNLQESLSVCLSFDFLENCKSTSSLAGLFLDGPGSAMLTEKFFLDERLQKPHPEL